MALVDVLIPTYNRVTALTALLTSLYQQTWQDFRIIISDQSGMVDLERSTTLQTLLRMHRTQGRRAAILRNLPRLGIAQQRHFLLQQAVAPYVLYLDDDLILDSRVIEGMVAVLQREQCGFVGRPVIGLSYRHDVSPQQQRIEFWDGPVTPEKVTPGSPAWQRFQWHNAVNPLHVTEKYGISWEHPRLYKIAWVGACVMYDTAKLHGVGGFSFWDRLPLDHCGEDVMAQLRVMRRYGGCGVLPSGVYHHELPTTLPNRAYDIPQKLNIHQESEAYA